MSSETDGDTILMSAADTIDFPAITDSPDLPAPDLPEPDPPNEAAAVTEPQLALDANLDPAPGLIQDPGLIPGLDTGAGAPLDRRERLMRALPLLAILGLQAALTLRLHNTAFEDEALYLYAGRMEIGHLLHGAALQGAYSSYFSGAPVLYPVLAAAVSAAGGLALARALSLVAMLAVTVLLHAITRRLFGPGAALGAAAVFAVSAPVLFLGHLATYDATCLFLLAAATAIVVRTAAAARPWFLLAGPVAALAVAVKYAGAMFVPTICVLALLAGWPALGRRALWRPLWLCAAVAGLLQLALRLGGTAYVTAITATTTNRAQGATPVSVIASESAAWGGLVAILAIAGAVIHARRARAWRARARRADVRHPDVRHPDVRRADVGWRARALLGAVLAGTVFLAPVYQMHLHTDVSLQKHIGFGLFFAAPLAGAAVARLVGAHVRRPHFGIALWSVAITLGLGQSWRMFQDWPSSEQFVSAFSRYLAPGDSYLVEVPEVPVYYLQGRPDAQPEQFWSTFAIRYSDPDGRVLTGMAGYADAVREGAFHTIAISGTVTPAADAIIERAVAASRRYRLAAVVHLTDGWGPLTYRIWVRRDT